MHVNAVARAHARGIAVVAKLFKSEHPRPRELAKLQHEYALLRSLDIPGVIKAYALEKYGNGLALIVQGVEAQPLSRRIAEGGIAIPTALTVALRLSEILESLHERQIVHKDIKPHKVPIERSARPIVSIRCGALAGSGGDTGWEGSDRVSSGACGLR